MRKRKVRDNERKLDIFNNKKKDLFLKTVLLRFVAWTGQHSQTFIYNYHLVSLYSKIFNKYVMTDKYKQRQMVQKKKKYRNMIIIKTSYVITTLHNIENVRRDAVVKGVEHISTIVLVNI